MPTTRKQGNNNPFVVISEDELHERIRSKVDETRFKNQPMSAVQFTFRDMDGKETYMLGLPKEIVVMLSNAVEEEPVSVNTTYPIAPVPTPEEITEHIIELVKQSPHFSNEHARNAAIALVNQGKYKVLPGGHVRIELKDNF